jgi:integrase
VLARAIAVGERVRGTVGALSNNCGKIDARTAEACVEVAGLREELAAAIDAARLGARSDYLRQQIGTLRERGDAAVPDPVGEFWARITRGRLSVKDVGFGLHLFFAFMIEMVSAFGPLGIVSYAEATRPETAETDVSRRDGPERVAARSDLPSRVNATTNRAAVRVDELYADYEIWCLSGSQRPLGKEEFVDEFDRVRASPQLAGKIKKFGSRYFGIAFVENNVARALPAQRGWVTETGMRYLPRSRARIRAARKSPQTKHVARMLLIGIYTGTRPGAILALRWMPSIDAGWFDLAAGVLHRADSNVRQTKKREPPAKIHGRLMPHLRRWHAADMAIGVTSEGEAVTKLRRSWESVARLAGRESRDGPHILRHTAATWMMRSGVDAFEIRLSRHVAGGLVGCVRESSPQVPRECCFRHWKTQAASDERERFRPPTCPRMFSSIL